MDAQVDERKTVYIEPNVNESSELTCGAEKTTCVFVSPVDSENFKDKEIKIELVEKPQEIHKKIPKLNFLDELKKKQGNKKPAMIKEFDREQKIFPSEKEEKDENMGKKSDFTFISSKAEMKKQPNKKEHVSVELLQVENKIENVEDIKTG